MKIIKKLHNNFYHILHNEKYILKNIYLYKMDNNEFPSLNSAEFEKHSIKKIQKKIRNKNIEKPIQ